MKNLPLIFTIALFNFLVILSLIYFSPRFLTSPSPSEQIPNPSRTPTIAPSAPSSPTISLTPTAPPVSSTPTTTPTPDPLANRCIITLDGQRYDVTDFRLIHGGGNIFRCGADMSAEFHGQHPVSFLNRLTPYKI